MDPLVTLSELLGSNPTTVNKKLIMPDCLASIQTFAPEVPVSSI